MQIRGIISTLRPILEQMKQRFHSTVVFIDVIAYDQSFKILLKLMIKR